MTQLPVLESETLAWTSLWEGQGRADAWSHSGAAVLPDGRFVFNEPGGRGLILMDEAGSTVERIPVPVGMAHGLHVEGDDLLIADPGDSAGEGQVLRVSTTSRIAKRLPAPAGAEGRWRPSSIAVDDDGVMWVADGYGDSLVYGIRQGHPAIVLDGSGSADLFDCPHGLIIDDRGPTASLVVADRGNRRLVVTRRRGSSCEKSGMTYSRARVASRVAATTCS